MNNNQNKIIGCLGVPFPADSTLINKSKKELIDMLHIAEHNYQVQVEANINQYNLLKLYLENQNYDDFMKMVSKTQIDWSEE